MKTVRLVVVAVCLCAIGLVVTSSLGGLGKRAPDPAPSSPSAQPSKEPSAGAVGASMAPPFTPSPTPTPPRVVAASTRILFTGNTFWGRYMDDWSRDSDLGVAYPFSRLDELDRESYDAWISGLECPMVEGLELSSAQQDSTLSFNCDPAYLEEAAKWFTAFTLANNHTDNQGAEAFTETKQHLTEAGIQYFGHYDPNELDEVCGLVILPATLTYDDGTNTPGNLPLAMCGHHGVFQIPSEDSLDLISHYADYLPVIAMPHMGAEYKATPDSIKTDTYRSMIDRGAMAVIGDHPHWIQTAESYKGKPIFYSLGNFMFDQQYNLEVTRSAGIDVTLSVEDSPSLAGWLELASDPSLNLTSAVARAEQLGLAPYSVKATYDIVGIRDDGRLPHPADKAEQADIEARLGWAELEEEFG